MGFNKLKLPTATPSLLVGAGAVPDFDRHLTSGRFDLRHYADDKGTKQEKKEKRLIKNQVKYDLNRVSGKMKELFKLPDAGGCSSTIPLKSRNYSLDDDTDVESETY